MQKYERSDGILCNTIIKAALMLLHVILSGVRPGGAGANGVEGSLVMHQILRFVNLRSAKIYYTQNDSLSLLMRTTYIDLL